MESESESNDEKPSTSYKRKSNTKPSTPEKKLKARGESTK